MNFLDNAERGVPSSRSNIQVPQSSRSRVQESYLDVTPKDDISSLSIVDPSSRDAYNRARERLVELEIEKEEQ